MKAENRSGLCGTTANRFTKRMWRSYVKYAKCMATPLGLLCMQLIYAGGCANYKLLRNCCIRRSCTPTATCEAHAAINKSEHRNAVHHFAHTPKESVLLGDCEENPKYGLTRRFTVRHYTIIKIELKTLKKTRFLWNDPL
ncbi:hypothetical protein EVAR_61930_1 [Eumeta japonica]|uniref:Uncharacterized protein n=1 Tax=Eumeta variegata TaxID=151549 RepID=A0A4C1ZMG2_EUMVA|nr:hypothetical protein EVAR_61930_1 [Eumeta japonica]